MSADPARRLQQKPPAVPDEEILVVTAPDDEDHPRLAEMRRMSLAAYSGRHRWHQSREVSESTRRVRMWSPYHDMNGIDIAEKSG